MSFCKKHKQVNAFIICLCVSFFLWLFITYGKDYEYSIFCPVSFIDGENRVEYFTQDSVLTLTVKTNGFNFLVKSAAVKKQHLTLVVDKLNIDLAKGRASVNTSRFKSQILSNLGFHGVEVNLLPSTINLSWNKLYSKRVKVVNNCEFNFQRPYKEYYPAELLTKEVVIEGPKADIINIDSICTQSIVYNNINKNTVFLVPLQLIDLPKSITCRLKSVPIRISTEKYTEDIAFLDVKPVRFEDYKSIKILPKQVKVRYLVAIKDYKKVNAKDINAYVLCSEDNLKENSKLKVYLTNVPKYIRIVSIVPEDVEYILFK